MESPPSAEKINWKNLGATSSKIGKLLIDRQQLEGLEKG